MTPSRALPDHLLSVTSADGASVRVSLFGGQLCSWQNAHGTERLFMSRATRWDGSAALRGGVPVIFPQFAGMGNLPKHGFARTLPWTLDGTSQADNGDGVIRLHLADGPATSAFLGRFRLQLTLRFNADVLTIDLVVENLGGQSFAFTAALHSYFQVDLQTSMLQGLQGMTYADSTAGAILREDDSAALVVEREVDRNYLQLQRPLRLQDRQKNLVITQQGFEDVVVWNPWREKAAALADLDDDEYREFICVEAAQINRAVTLAPGQRWRGCQSVHIDSA